MLGVTATVARAFKCITYCSLEISALSHSTLHESPWQEVALASRFQAATRDTCLVRHLLFTHSFLDALIEWEFQYVTEMKDRFRSSHKYFLLVLVLCETFNAASVTAQPYIVASGRTYPGPNPTDGMLDLPQVLSWSATQLTTKFNGSDVSISLSRASNEAESLSGPFRSLYLPLEIIVVGRVNVTRTCLVGLPALPCTVQGLPLGNYSIAIRKVSTPFDCYSSLNSPLLLDVS